MKKFKFSICVPVFNVEKYLGRCLDSLVSQTYKNIEIICVDDGSTDGSLAILEEFAKNDNRIVVLKHEGNKGLLQARKTAVLKATGDYILFVDSDDSIALNTCEVIAQNLQNDEVDIFALGYNLDFSKSLSDLAIKMARAFYATPTAKKSGNEIFKMCFLRQEIAHNVIGKAFKRELCVKVYSNIIDGNIVMSEDLYAYMKLAFFAKTFKSISAKLYNYTYGTGISTQKTINIKTFEKTAKTMVLFDDLKKFFDKEGAGEYCFEAIQKWEEKVFEDCVGNFVYNIPTAEKSIAFDVLIKYFGKEKVFMKLAGFYFSNQAMICDAAANSKAILHEKKDIKTIGFFYYKLGNGGVERVIQMLVPMFLKMGYKVVCFSEQELSSESYKFPRNVKIEVVPNSIGVVNLDYAKRAKIFGDLLVENKVDLMLYQAYNSEIFGFDALLCRLNNIYVVPTFHGVLLNAKNYLCGDFLKKTSYYKLCDTIHVLTTAERTFWKAYGFKTKYIPNPLTFDVSKTEVSKLDNKSCLWLARLEPVQKQPEKAIEIFKRVVDDVPDAKLVMVGKADSKEYEKMLKRLVKKNNLEENIEFVGYTKNVDEYYKNASVFLMTSAFEAYPMTLGEAMSYGLPCVMFNLPYVELSKDNKGIAICDQDDVDAAAEMIVKILTNKILRKEMGRESREYIENVSRYNIQKDWEDLIADLPNGNTIEVVDEYAKIIPTIAETCLFNPFAKNAYRGPKVSIFKKFRRKVKQIGFFPTVKLCFKTLFSKR